MRLYEIRLKNGSSHKAFVTFLDNVTSLNAKAPGYSGISSTCVVAHSQDAETIHLIVSRGMQEYEDDIRVVEITAKTLTGKNPSHIVYRDLIDSYYLPYNKFPNL